MPDGRRVDALIRETPDGLTLEEIGAMYGVTRERIRQIEARACLQFASVALDTELAVCCPDEASARFIMASARVALTSGIGTLDERARAWMKALHMRRGTARERTPKRDEDDADEEVAA